MGVEIDKLLQATGGDVFRPNLFRVQIASGSLATILGTEDFTFICKGASIPAGTVGTVIVPVLGRQLKIAGDRTFDEWNVTVIADRVFKYRSAFEEWQNRVNQWSRNIQSTVDSRGYMGIARVDALDRQQNVVKTYTVEYLWPSNLAPMDLSFESTDTAGEFGVTFQVSGVTPGTAGASVSVALAGGVSVSANVVGSLGL